jgi:hypothetical protein
MVKRFLLAPIVIATIFSVVVAGVASAQGQGTRPQSQGTSTGGATGGFCSALVARVSNIEQKVSDQIGKLRQAEDNRGSKFSDEWNKFINKRETVRSEEDAKIESRIAKLDSTATTDAQKQAVAAFRSAIKAALSAKRSAIDAALKSFHDGVAALLTARRDAIEGAFKARLDAFNAAVEKAKTDCASGVSAKTVRTEFISALKSAQTQFVSARKANDDFNTKMKQLTAAKKTALDKAMSDFRTAVTQARDELKAALGKSNSTSTNQ